MTVTKKEFKLRWESGPDGGGITFDDVATAAKDWGLFATPRVHPMAEVLRAVLAAAGVEEQL